MKRLIGIFNTKQQFKKQSKKIKAVKSIIFLVITFSILFILYITKYQALINESTELADKHCLDVNPLIIERKEKYTESMLLADLNTEVAGEVFNEYLKISKKYVEAEKQWLEQQKAFLNRWDVKLVLDKNVQEAGMWQYRVYEADYRSIDAVTRAIGTEDTKEHDRFIQLSQRATADSQRAQMEYAKLWENRPSSFDVRSYFLTIPPSKCPDKNFNIPDVKKELII